MGGWIGRGGGRGREGGREEVLPPHWTLHKAGYAYRETLESDWIWQNKPPAGTKWLAPAAAAVAAAKEATRLKEEERLLMERRNENIGSVPFTTPSAQTMHREPAPDCSRTDKKRPTLRARYRVVCDCNPRPCQWAYEALSEVDNRVEDALNSIVSGKHPHRTPRKFEDLYADREPPKKRGFR